MKLEEKIAKLLQTFCERRGELISKDEIISAVWDGRELSEQTVPVAISKLRKALGDDINDPQMLATIPRQGYRLIEDAAPIVKPTSTSSNYRNYIMISFALLAMFFISELFIFKTNNEPENYIQVANSEKPGVIVTINDVRTTEATKDRIFHAISISELSSYYLAQVPDILVIRHWWNLDAPDPTGGIFTRYGTATPVYSLKATLLDEGEEGVVTFILSDPRTDEVLWTGLHTVSRGSEGLFEVLSSMLSRLKLSTQVTAQMAPIEDHRFWNARYYMQLSNIGAAKYAYSFLTSLIADDKDEKEVQATTEALIARWGTALGDDVKEIQGLERQTKSQNISEGTHIALVDAAAVSLYRDKSPAGAIRLLERALSRAPGDHYALSLFGEAKEQLGDHEEAIIAYEKATRLAPYARSYIARLTELKGEDNSGTQIVTPSKKGM